jgi:flagellar assembly protein FliH
MSNGRLQRFDFQHLRDFRGPIAVNEAAIATGAQAQAPEAPPAPIFSETDLDHARDAGKKLGYAEGFEAGMQQSKTEASANARDLASALNRIGDQLAQLLSTHQQLIDQQSAEITDLVLMIARKVAGDALDANGYAAVRGLVERCLPVVFSKPRVLLELSPNMMGHAEAMLRQHFDEAGFEGELEFRALDMLEDTDIRISWANGEASRSNAALWQNIEQLLRQAPLTPTLNHEGENHG